VWIILLPSDLAFSGFFFFHDFEILKNTRQK
jgi:hypothetical protein